MAVNYLNGLAPIVTVTGPGNLHHLTYDSVPSLNGPGAVGMINTTHNGTTNFLLGFSYNYRGYAFYWDGQAPAFWRVSGNSPFIEPVGTSWENATGVPWGSSEIELGINVATQAASATKAGGEIPVFFSADYFQL
ncbi:hypothetical protein FB45DRAFT_1106531 [Roridomyces roridus]|uniref:Uncharacterized protein n=1 Tax=Roridomyces roridus TaxID=1738132 RepID=A0AAD7FCK0_9AGAR|nr:hypothetical protein FB45DRAFT_1106531 [Roridomyces roridus]